VLSEDDSKKFLNTYRINVTLPRFANDANGAAMAASSIGYPVVMKIQSRIYLINPMSEEYNLT